MKLGIIGNGFVGRATALLASETNEVLVYDVDPCKCIPEGLTLGDMKDCQLLFVCVPTPMNEDESCYTGIVERVIRDIRAANLPGHIVVRSTVPVGFCEAHKVNFMPEFLTEKNWREDFMSCKHWIVGTDVKESALTDPASFAACIQEALKNSSLVVHFDIRVCPTRDAEMCKYFRNCFLATKVAFCNEIASFCAQRGVSYERVRALAVLDERIGESHTAVPGHDGKYGFGGTCLPKDLNSLIKQMDGSAVVLKAVKTRNETIDRVERDWMELEGRAVAAKCRMCGKVMNDMHVCS